MSNLEKFINDDSISDLDPLIKMAVIHYQFESIHPFYDGNGRTGRIINILYLVLKGLLDYPMLYLSRFIIQNKGEYYKVLRDTRKLNDWESLVMYFLKSVEQTSKYTIELVSKIKVVMHSYKNNLRMELPKIYSQELMNVLFSYPYTKIDFVQKTMNISYLTARKYLEILSDKKYLTKVQLGKSNYYINEHLLNIFVI